MDTFRLEYKPLTESQSKRVIEIKEKAVELERLLNEPIEPLPDPRMIALAKTKLEEAIMWAVKGLTS